VGSDEGTEALRALAINLMVNSGSVWLAPRDLSGLPLPVPRPVVRPFKLCDRRYSPVFRSTRVLVSYKFTPTHLMNFLGPRGCRRICLTHDARGHFAAHRREADPSHNSAMSGIAPGLVQ
jgi:hypothetical protein